jgi:diguanylate cyclase (GGDEF)-like protein
MKQRPEDQPAQPPTMQPRMERYAAPLIVGGLGVVLAGLAVDALWMASAARQATASLVAVVLLVLGISLLRGVWAGFRRYQQGLEHWGRREVQLSHQREHLAAHVIQQAFYDALTGLPNRALFVDRLNHALAGANRQNARLAVLLLDLDRFKVVNDSLGHAAGDELLLAVAQRLSSCIRPIDSAARVGADEFTILLEDISGETQAVHVAERILESLHTPFQLHGHDVFATTSIGIVVATTAAYTAADLLRDADIALYRAKARGKARYELFDTSMHTRAIDRLQLEVDLRQSIANRDFVVHYQPTVNVETGRVVALEALVRWQHPRRGMISPTEFIPVAEETGLIRPLGRQVMLEACRQAREWQTRYALQPAPLISVNLSAQEFQQPNLVEQITLVLDETGLAPGMLQLEITESVVMDDAPTTLRTLRALKQLGVRLAIDDFGTGYSSLSYLKRFPVDVLKVDKAFVSGIDDDAEDAAIVKAIITLAHTLGMQVIAEGVESSTQVARLRALGCRHAQGYYFARPLTCDAATTMLTAEAAGSLASYSVRAGQV